MSDDLTRELRRIGRELPHIVVDTREQAPLTFEAFSSVVDTLPVGDYGLGGFSDWNNPAFVVERKSLSDLIGSLSSGRERFVREVEKLRQFRFRALVIEAHREEVIIGEYQSQMAPQSILASLDALQVRTGLHVAWCGDRTGAAAQIEGWARQFIRGVVKDVQRLARTKAVA